MGHREWTGDIAWTEKGRGSTGRERGRRRKDGEGEERRKMEVVKIAGEHGWDGQDGPCTGR